MSIRILTIDDHPLVRNGISAMLEVEPDLVVAGCRAGVLEFQNNYMVQGGRITVSRQWVGPDLGYITIQELRP